MLTTKEAIDIMQAAIAELELASRRGDDRVNVGRSVPDRVTFDVCDTGATVTVIRRGDGNTIHVSLPKEVM